MNEDMLRETIGEKTKIYDGAILDVQKWSVTLSNGNPAFREVVLHRGASAIVPVDEEGNVTMGETDFDDDEFLDLVKMPLKDAVSMIARGEISDGKTALAILMADKALHAEEK